MKSLYKLFYFKLNLSKILFISLLVFLFSGLQLDSSKAVCGDEFSICTPEESAAVTERALEEEKARSSNLDPCVGVGSIWVLGANRLGCEIWLYLTKFILQISAELLNLSAKLFDFTTQKFVLQISTMFKDESVINAEGVMMPASDKAYIYGGWSVIRDLANIAAFFGAVYTGFRYITGSDSLDFKKSVTKLILYSILVNFSFPIAKFLIDVSNIISLQIYGGMSEYKIGNNILSENILSAMNLNSLVSQLGSANPDFKGFSSFSLMWLAIIYLFSAFAVFLYAALMILVRSFILLACVILSPLMFLNFAFPKLTELHEKWRENFFGQLIFAPILMFGFWLSFILLQAATLTSTVPETSVPSYNDVSQLINMLLAILSLFLTVKLASSVSGSAGRGISGIVGSGMKNLGLAAATGGAGFAFRSTAGRLGSAMANSNWVKNTGKENGATRRMAAALTGSAGNRLSNFNLAGTKSFNEKKSGNLKEDKMVFQTENSQQIKATGMEDYFAQAKTKEELELAKEEMAKRKSDPSYKGNNDLFGRKAKQKSFELDQNVRKEMRLGNVSAGNRAEYRELAEQINTKSKFDKDDDNTELRNQRLEKAKQLRSDRLESLKNTSTTQVFANNIGASTGAAYEAVTDNVVTRGVGSAVDAVIVNPLKKVGDVLDRPSAIGGAVRNIGDGFRSKKNINRNTDTETSSSDQKSPDTEVRKLSKAEQSERDTAK
jgi:hypothetical protein